MSNYKSSKLFEGIKRVLDQNAPTFATFGSILGVGLTVYFMHKASRQAAKVEEKYEETIENLEDSAADENGDPLDEDELKQEKTRLKIDKYMRLVYIYRWALLSGIGSAGFAVLSNYLNGRTIAGLTTLLALNQDKLQKGCEKVKELVGEDKFKELQENVEKELFGEKLAKGEVTREKSKKPLMPTKADNAPWDDLEIIVVPQYDYIWELPKDLAKNVIDECNKMFETDKTAYMDFNAFRKKLRLTSVTGFENLKWDASNPFKARISKNINYGDGVVNGIIFSNLPDIEVSLTR